MAKKYNKAKSIEKEPEVHKDLKGFSIKINSFGEMESTYSIEEINAFLNSKINSTKTEEE